MTQTHQPPQMETTGKKGGQAISRRNIPMAVKTSILVSILGISLLLGYFLLTDGHDWGDDFAAYLMQAQAITEGKVGEFVSRNTFTIENSMPGLGPTVYPWGYPLVLAPLVRLLGINLVAIKLLNLCFYLLFLVVAYFLFRSRLSFVETCLVVAVFAVHPVMLNSINEILSDLLFLFLSTLCMLIIDRWVASNIIAMTWLRGFLLGLVIFAAIQVRTTGLLLLLVLFVCQMVEGFHWLHNNNSGPRKKILIHAIPYMVVLVLWLIFLLILPAGGEGYLGQLSLENISRIAYDNLMFYGKELLPVFLNPIPYSRRVCLVLLLLSALGAAVNLRRDYPFVTYSLATIFVYLLWPYTQGVRFIFPLLPFWVYFILRGIQWLLDRLVKFRVVGARFTFLTRIVPAVVLVAAVAFFFTATIHLARTNLENDRQTGGPFSPESAALFQFIQSNNPPGSVVGFFKPRAMRLLTNRDSFTLTSCQQLAQADCFVAHKFKKLEPQGQIRIDALADCKSEGFEIEMVYEQPAFVVYRINPSP